MLCVFLGASAALAVGAEPPGHRSRVNEWVSLPVLYGGCPALSSRAPHISAGEIAPTSSRPPNTGNGVVVSSGQTVFYAGPAPKGIDSATAAAHKNTGQAASPAPSSAVAHSGGNVAAHSSPPTTVPHPVHTTGKKARAWTVQVASFEALDQAETLQQTLCQKGYDARIVGSSRPFTVQVGAFPSSDSAMVVARHLSSREYTVFVTLAKP